MFEFIEEQTDESLFCILTDTSSTPERFNEFTVTDTVDVTFLLNGFYTYKIYEQPNGSGNLDPDGLTIVEVGRMHVYQTETAPNYYDNENETSNVYE